MQLYDIGLFVYGNKAKETKARWMRDGVEEYFDRMTAACARQDELMNQIEDDLAHVEAKFIRRKLFRPTLVHARQQAIRARVEDLVLTHVPLLLKIW